MNAARWIGLGLLALASASCSGPARERVVRLLFDDPPTPPDSAGVSTDAGASNAAKGVGDGADGAAAGEAALADAEGAPVVYRKHSPYEERECDACHLVESSFTFLSGFAGETAPSSFDDASGARLRAPREELCFECHDDMTADELEAAGEIVHPPAEEGECLECHDPHRSRFPALLRDGATAHAVCWSCHDEEEFEDADGHAGLVGRERDCWICHEAHASDEAYLLKS